jgi:glycosyltransferase involved in cell wall biosynthesis
VRISWLTRYGPEGASSRYRAYQFMEPLAATGITSASEVLAPWHGRRREQIAGIWRRSGAIARLSADSDVIVIQKEPIMPASAWRLIRRQIRTESTPVIWDIDDAVWIGRRGVETMAVEMAQAATLVVAGNNELAKWALQAGARAVETIPTCYSPLPFSLSASSSRDHVKLVWIGSPATASRLADVETRLHQVLSDPQVRLTMIGAGPPRSLANHPRIEVVDWSPRAEHAQLASADYGLAFLPRTSYADHKCGFKVVQYMAYGVVPIATDNEVHRTIVGDVGMLVGEGTSAETLRSFVAEPPSVSLREAVRERWRAAYSVSVGTEQWRGVLERLAS